MADERDLRGMMSENEREARAEGRSRARSINAVGAYVDQSSAEFSSELGRSRNDLRRITESARKLRVERMAGTEGIREIERSVSGILDKVGYVFDIMGRSVLKISTITRETLSAYKQTLQRELGINAPNTVAMALSRATPIFGYFAAKFLETGVFRKFSDAIKNKLSEAASVVGQKFKSSFGASRAARGGERIPGLQGGGIVGKPGLAKVHAAEAVVPLTKMFSEFKKIFSPIRAELGGIRELVQNISEPNAEAAGPGGLYGMIRDLMRDLPIAKSIVKFTDTLGKPLRWLFSTQSKYKARVPKGANVLGNMATTLGMIYADFMHKYDHIILILKAMAMKAGVPLSALRENVAMAPTGIQQIRAGIRGLRRWFKPVPSRTPEKEGAEKGPGSIISTLLGLMGVGEKDIRTGMGKDVFTHPFKALGRLWKGKSAREKGGGPGGPGLGKVWKESEEERGGGLVSKVTGGLSKSATSILVKISRIVSTEKTSIKIQKTLQDILDHSKGYGRKLWDLILFVFSSIGSAVKSIFSHIPGLDKLFPRRIPIPGGGGGRAPKEKPLPTPGGPQRPTPKGKGRFRKGVGKAGAAIGGLIGVGGAIEGVLNAKEMGVSKLAGGIGGALSFGSLEGGIESAFMGGIMGASIGANFGGPWGIAIGGVAGALLGYVGGKNIAKAVDAIWDGIKVAAEWIKKFVFGGGLVETLGKMIWNWVKPKEKTLAEDVGKIPGTAGMTPEMMTGGIGDAGWLGGKKYGRTREMGDGPVSGKAVGAYSDLGSTISEAIKAGFADIGKIIKQEYEKESLLGQAGGLAQKAIGGAGNIMKRLGETGIGRAIAEGATVVGERLGSLAGIKKMPDVDISGVKQPIWSNFTAMADEYKKGTGKDIQLNSAFRSATKQAELYKTNPYAAPPGKSPHEKGMALDINSANAFELSKMGLLDKYGFYQPMRNEPWHLQMSGLKQVGDVRDRNLGTPYSTKDLTKGEVESALLGMSGLSDILKPALGSLDKSVKGMNAAIINTSNVITTMSNNQQSGGGGQSSAGGFDPEIIAILNGNV